MRFLCIVAVLGLVGCGSGAAADESESARTDEQTSSGDTGGDVGEASPPATPISSRPGADGGMTGGMGGGGSSGGTDGGSSGGTGGGTGGDGCSITRTGGGGRDPEGVIPVCCAPPNGARAALDELFDRLNDYRRQKGKPALTYDPRLEASIQGHCLHMSQHGFFDHEAPEASVRSPQDRATLCGTSAEGENLAGGHANPAAVMASWKGSAGHDANMLGPYKRLGLCRAGSYWGQVFGR